MNRRVRLSIMHRIVHVLAEGDGTRTLCGQQVATNAVPANEERVTCAGCLRVLGKGQVRG